MKCVSEAIKSRPNTDTPVFTTRLALPPDYENVSNFMSEFYYKGEPTVQSCGLVGTEAPECWRQLMYNVVRNGLSIIAEDHERCVIGAALNSLIYPSTSKEQREFAKTCCDSMKVRRIIEFFSYQHEQAALWERLCVPRLFEIAAVTVDPFYQGLGIARRLFVESWYLARDCSYPAIVVFCNSSHTASLCADLGWIWAMNSPFDQYMYDGEQFFTEVKEPHTQWKVYFDLLQDCKPYCRRSKRCTKVTHPPKI
ncbi:PREDICTED: uncharacterized protein LOC107187426 [Dufourea novaeangliae]|uniref:uncharacterized protein LOC107187426 n=1 Tax=Dufourea novaeangliae TaxID=178035 RepID=UPI000767D688|nr:PREDICTED: uncharacterized protein LOC107187426 [Dufourea novaeangliae]